VTQPSPSPSPPLRRVVLLGMMGAGKTATGTALAARLGWSYWDNDVELQRDTGRDARTLVAEQGADREHAEETRVLLEGLRREEPSVVAAPGSAVLDPAAVEALQREWVVFLRARVETLARRVRAGHHRPFLDADVEVTLHQLEAQRHGLYEALADLVVDVDDLSPEQVVERILAAGPFGGSRR